MDKAQITIRCFEHTDLEDGIAILVRAFSGGALYQYIEPDKRKRPAFLDTVFRYRLTHRREQRDGTLLLVNGRPAALAFWEWQETGYTGIENLLNAANNFGAACAARWRHFHTVLFPLLESAYTAPHWSPGPFAVDCAFQGQGLGGILMREKIATLPPHGAPCLLGTQDPANVRFYQHLGFTLTATAPITSSLTCYAMTRLQ
jgi:GNAT superfamily N-acetyltransferase